MEQTKHKGKKKSNNELFAQYLGIYLVSGFDGRNTDELEIRFGVADVSGKAANEL